MIQIQEVRTYPYDPAVYGLLKAKRRLARVTFVTGTGRDQRPYRHDHVEQMIRPLLDGIFEAMRTSPYAPFPWPEKIKWVYDHEEQELVIHSQVTGFGVTVVVEDVPQTDGQDTETPECLELRS